MALKKEHVDYLIDLITSNRYKDELRQILKARKNNLEDYLSTYHTSDDLYFEQDRIHEVEVLKEILKELGEWHGEK